MTWQITEPAAKNGIKTIFVDAGELFRYYYDQTAWQYRREVVFCEILAERIK